MSARQSYLDINDKLMLPMFGQHFFQPSRMHDQFMPEKYFFDNCFPTELSDRKEIDLAIILHHLVMNFHNEDEVTPRFRNDRTNLNILRVERKKGLQRLRENRCKMFGYFCVALAVGCYFWLIIYMAARAMK